MNEEDRAELLRLGPDRMEFRVGKILSQHAAADRRAPQALLLDRGFQLLNREIGKLKREGSESAEPLRPRRTEFSQLFVLKLDDRGCRIAVLSVPERIDRQHLHIDRHGVHFLETLLD